MSDKQELIKPADNINFVDLAVNVGANMFCLNSCLEVSYAKLSGQEKSCFENCLNIYSRFHDSYDKNFNLN